MREKRDQGRDKLVFHKILFFFGFSVKWQAYKIQFKNGVGKKSQLCETLLMECEHDAKKRMIEREREKLTDYGCDTVLMLIT